MTHAEKFGWYMEMIRKYRSMSRDELAKRVNLSKTTINGYATGRITPPLDNIFAIAEALGVTVDSLLVFPPVEVIKWWNAIDDFSGIAE